MRQLILTVILTVAFLTKINAQHSKPDTIIATKITTKIHFDGILNDSIWRAIPRIKNFTQREPEFNSPATERTEVAIIYDEFAMYIGVWCYNSDKSSITTKYMSRDFDYKKDDNFQTIISPFNDKRNGYMFVINPNGARADLMVYGGEEGNMDWNGVWDAKTSITKEGWFAEIFIPFNTLQFNNNTVLDWAINFERSIAVKNEQSLWQGWSRDNSIFAVVNAGTLTGLKNINYAKKFELKPYTLLGWQSETAVKTKYPFKIGGDLNINLSPTLKLNLTMDTDFAQVESDRIPVNLTRFNQYYPEKREFFLESYNLYQFGLGNSNNIYYSRKIGVENKQSVPIIAGARLFGKIGANNIGFLSIQEASTDTKPSSNATVLRYKRDIGSQSYIGGILTNKINSEGSNTVIGIDGNYRTSKFLKNKNLVLSANMALSSNDYKTEKNSLAYRFFIDYPNDLIDIFLSASSIQENFTPDLGFLNRSNYEAIKWNLRIDPRWFNSLGIKRMLFKPWSAVIFRTQITKEIESFYNETRPLGFELISGGSFEFNLIQSYERIDDTFSLSDNFEITPEKYMMFRKELQFTTSQSRKIWLFALYNWGDFYSGKIQTIESGLGINLNAHLNLRNDYTLNKVVLNEETLYIHELATYLNYAFTTKLNLSLFSQWNSLDDIMFFNLRFHWIPKIGSDMYIVYNQGYDNLKQFDFLRPKTTTGVMKFVYRFTF